MKSNNSKSELEKWWWFEYNQESYVNNTLDDAPKKNRKLTSLPVVRIKNCINGFTVNSKIISTRFIEYYFVSNAISFISNDKNSSSYIKSYEKYIKLIAAENESKCNNDIVFNLRRWIENSLKPGYINHVYIEAGTKYSYCII